MCPTQLKVEHLQLLHIKRTPPWSCISFWGSGCIKEALPKTECQAKPLACQASCGFRPGLATGLGALVILQSFHQSARGILHCLSSGGRSL